MPFAPSVNLPRPAAVRRRLCLCLAVIALLAAGCASTPSDAPSCSGQRRPANPHSSVLAPEVQPTPVATAGQCRGGQQ